MNNQWTYSDKENVWQEDSFATKEEAILHGSVNHEHFYVGQLIQYAELEFTVEHIQEII